VTANFIHREVDYRDKYGAWFSEGASTYEAQHNLNTEWSNFFGAVTVRTLSRYIRLPAGIALEIGCGTGALTRGYLSNGLADCVLATDISAEMLAEATKRTEPGRAMFCVQDVHDLTIAPGSINVVASSSILHHLLDLPKCLSQIHEVLAPDGVALFLEPFYAGYRALAFMLRFALAEVASRSPRPPKQLEQLQKLVASYTSDLEYQHAHRRNPEMLASRDDKYLFVREELRPLAHAAGFKTVVFESFFDAVSSVRENVMRDVAIDIASSLLKEGQIQEPLIDLRASGILDQFSQFYGEFFLSEFSPQELCIFVKS
jgi:ubiquinone/menaquinone biosynthesis C-methylase UbiE